VIVRAATLERIRSDTDGLFRSGVGTVRSSGRSVRTLVSEALREVKRFDTEAAHPGADAVALGAATLPLELVLDGAKRI
jgi:hypothetical protein